MYCGQVPSRGRKQVGYISEYYDGIMIPLVDMSIVFIMHYTEGGEGHRSALLWLLWVLRLAALGGCGCSNELYVLWDGEGKRSALCLFRYFDLPY